MNKTDNPCYAPGALWQTRTNISVVSYTDVKSNSKNSVSVVPKNEFVVLLGYILHPSYEETIYFLWKEKTWFANRVDVGLYFNTNPNLINTNGLFS